MSLSCLQRLLLLRIENGKIERLGTDKIAKTYRTVPKNDASSLKLRIARRA